MQEQMLQFNPEKERYWNDWLKNALKSIEDDESSKLLSASLLKMEKDLYSVMQLAINLRQFEVPKKEFEFCDFKRVVKFRSYNSSKEELKRNLGIDVISIYGTGYFTAMDGLLLSPEVRERINFDAKDKQYNLESIPQSIVDSHDFVFAIYCHSGYIFVPKKTALLRWVQRSFNLEYFDLESGIG